MADEDPPAPDETQTPTETPTNPAPAAGEKLYTRAELDAIVRGKVIEAKRKAGTGKPKPKDPPEDQPDVAGKLQEMAEKLAELETNNAFSSALLKVPNAGDLNDTQIKALRNMFSPETPGDIVKLAAELYGSKAKDPEPEKPETPAPAPAPGTPPRTPPLPFVPGAPSGAPREAADDPRQWDKSTITQLRQRPGANGRSEFLERIEAYKNTLPGSLGLFKRRVPKG